MEEIAFGDWPGQVADLSGGANPWLPAYGFQPPHPYLERDDFVGNPDADFFFDGNVDQHYFYLETIQEETSDDLRSESDLSESRDSPAGWLATDSESGSVIRIDTLPLDEVDSGSEREIACPSKRRRQDNAATNGISNSLSISNYSDDESNYSLSRSSSLLQFETLERQCQDISSSSPSILSAFSFDSLEVQRKVDVSPDSLEDEEDEEDCCEPEPSDYYKTLKIDLNLSKRNIDRSRDSLLYGHVRFGSDSESSDDGERRISSSYSSKLSKSFEELAIQKTKMSSENLSEDSGYGDHHSNFVLQRFGTKTRSNSNPDVRVGYENEEDKRPRNGDIWETKNSAAFYAYDSDRAGSGKNGTSSREVPSVSHFGSSYQDLRIINQCDISKELKEMLLAIERSARLTPSSDDATSSRVNLDETECDVLRSNYKTASASEPDLLVGCRRADDLQVSDAFRFAHPFSEKKGPRENWTCSVPKNLNLAGELFSRDSWGFASIAAKNCDIADYAGFGRNARMEVNVIVEPSAQIPESCSSDSELEMERTYGREGSYAEAMRNRVDLSDDEYSVRGNRGTITEFDKKILKTISETSMQSLRDAEIDDSQTHVRTFASTPISSRRRNVVSTPNLASFESDFEKYYSDAGSRDANTNFPRKISPADRSTSTGGGLSDEDEKTGVSLARSLGGSNKGVHFCPVVAQVNWHDEGDTTTTDKESTYSFSSTSPDPEARRRSPGPPPSTPPLARPEPRIPRQLSSSEPELRKEGGSSLNKVESRMSNRPNPVRERAFSQPDVGGLQRKGSQLVRKDSDGGVLISYVDTDGIKYKHSHLGDVYKSMPPTPVGDGHVLNIGSDKNAMSLQKGTVANRHQAYQQQQPCGMEPVTVRKKSGGKLGGFFSRLASFRFSTRKASDEKNKLNAKKNSSGANNGVVSSTLTGQRIATKDDYIYIPLKGPEKGRGHDEDQQVQQQHPKRRDQREPVRANAAAPSPSTGKPPLPKAPPRVVGASVKRRTGSDAFAHSVRPEHRTIDSGDAFPRPMEPMGLIETDLDTEVTVITSGAHAKTRSLMNLGAEAPRHAGLAAPPHPARPHKSMEFLLDKQNLKVVENGQYAVGSHIEKSPALSLRRVSHEMEFDYQMPGDLGYRFHQKEWVRLDALWKIREGSPEPPENELQKGERVMSEHQLRIQRSLQKLTIPDWYKQNQVPREGFLLKKSVNRERWTGTSSKTPSLSSLGSNNQSPLVLSPTPQTQPFVRWSTSKINSTASSPCASVRSSFNTRQPNGSISPSSVRSSFSYRQPYLGWRSQERLTRPPRTPAERLASSVYVQQQHQREQQQQHQHNRQHHQQESPEIQTSIKEVTSAIVHYVSALKPDTEGVTTASRSSSVSPRGSQKLCWLESSFVGTRPLDTPQTPVTLAESNTPSPVISSSSGLRLDLQKSHNDISSQLYVEQSKPSPGSTTLEDVLDSLLGLPPSTRAPSPSHQETASANTSPSHLGEASRAAEQFRRHSEGSEPVSRQPGVPRRVSFHSSPVLRCRYSRCGRVVSTASNEAREFKHCHNCSYMYCSKSCRRAHWEKHRKSCLFSRVGTLCRQVLAASKEQPDTLLRVSLIARRGYLSHGPGAVKCFFPCPEAAEKFLVEGLLSFGELTYVRWTDLLPTEMGPQMYKELVKMCKNYNPDTKLVLYVTVCVVSEVPASKAVKWERQLVSRCAKMRLSKDVPIPERDVTENLETLVLTCIPTENDKLREHVFSNVQQQLKMRGISLRKQYPEIYQQLCKYVEKKSEDFIRTTVYPKDNVSGKSFMCIIMLDSRPEEVKQVSAAGVRVNIVNLLENCDP